MRRVLVVGSGQRVREAALPAIRSLPDAWELDGIASRKPKTVESEGASLDVEPLDALTRERLSGVDLVYVVVKKQAVAHVLHLLGELDPRGTDLLLETPVVPFVHVGRTKPIEAFRAAWVSEDCATLPVWDAVRAYVDSGAIGELREAVLERSAYAYHGVAMLKSLLGCPTVASARRERLDAGDARRTLRFANGTTGVAVEPRDYARGRIVLRGTTGVLADHDPAAPHARLAAVEQAGRCLGFRAGDAQLALDPAEAALMGEKSAGAGVTAWMDGLKRVGFRRLLASIAAGRGAYPWRDALDDMVVDYHLEKLGRYRANPLTSARSPLLRPLMRLAAFAARR